MEKYESRNGTKHRHPLIKIAGYSFGAIMFMAVGYGMGSELREVRLAKEADTPRLVLVDRLFEDETNDYIFVEQNENKFVPLQEYLKGIENIAERDIQRIKIKECLGLYK